MKVIPEGDGLMFGICVCAFIVSYHKNHTLDVCARLFLDPG